MKLKIMVLPDADLTGEKGDLVSVQTAELQDGDTLIMHIKQDISPVEIHAIRENFKKLMGGVKTAVFNSKEEITFTILKKEMEKNDTTSDSN